MLAKVLATQPPSAKQPKRPLSKSQAALDARIDRLFKDVLPNSPYILRLQQSEGKRLPQPTHAYYWRNGTHFAPDEHELQYMTFRTPSESMLRAHGQWDDGKGGIAPREVAPSQNSSGRTPLNGQTAKKKISLADYKNREKSKSVGKDVVPVPQAKIVENNLVDASVEGEDKRSKAGADEPKVQNDTLTQETEAEPNILGQQASTTRPAEDPELSAPLPFETTSVLPQAKKPRLSTEDPSSKPLEAENTVKFSTPQASTNEARPIPITATVTSAAQEKHANNAPHINKDQIQSEKKHKAQPLPPMISPTLPSVEKYKPPTILSPTLPPEIEDMIAEAAANRPKTNGSYTASSRTASSSISSTRLRSDTATSISQTSGDANTKSDSPAPPPAIKRQANKPVSTTTKPDAVDQGTHTDLRLKLWVKWKIKKKQNRKNLIQYMKLKSTPTKVHWGGYRRIQQSRPVLHSKEVMPSIRKRERVEEESELPRKRRRGSDLSAVPPEPFDSSLPAPKQTSAQKTRLSAPTSNPTSTAMRRAGSGQGSAATPAGQSQSGTPSVVDKESPSKQEMRAEFVAESNRLVSLARDLKHESDKYFKLENPASDQLRLGLVIGAESVICFILAFVVTDEPSRRTNRPGDSSTWKSILRLLRALTQQSKPFRYLHGLLNQLEGVIRDIIHHYDLVAIRNMLGDHEKAASENQESALQKYHALLKDSYENEMRAATAWREGHAALWVGEIQSAFPKTWRQARSLPGRGKGQDAVNIKDYAKDGFALPMGNLTSGLEAVNVGLSLLSELCEKEGTSWKPKLVLRYVGPVPEARA